MPDMLNEMDRVVLAEDLPEENLSAGDEGLVIDVRQHGRGGYTGPDGYTAEFSGGLSGGVREYTHVNLRPEQIRPAEGTPTPAPASA